eukprot:scpid79910/ scgid6851/ Uncharacterized protein yqjG
MAKELFLKANNAKGEFVRVAASFRNFIRADPQAKFPAEAGRYHLYLSLACPWASRTYFLLKAKGLEKVISKSVVHWKISGDRSWEFIPGKYRCDADTVLGKETIREIYQTSDPGYSGRVTVPVLFDKKTKKIVNNESSEIIRMLNTEFNEFCETSEQRKLDLYPEELRSTIEKWNDFCYPNVNNGVYRSGFATSQEAYDTAVAQLFDALDTLEEHLSQNRYLAGRTFTEADIRLFVTLVRFDMVYVGHFKCNKRRIVDYPNLWAYTRELYQMPGVDETVDRFHIEHHYQESHGQINPHGIVAIGPQLDFTIPHGRDVQFA